MDWAQAQQEGIELDLLWEFAPEEEFGFEQLAAEYYGERADARQQAAVLLRLHGAPHYFSRRGKGRFRKAGREVLQAALAGIARRQELERRIEADAQQLQQGSCPPGIAERLYSLLFKPDKNSPEYKALALAVRQSAKGALQLLREAGAIGSPWRFHMQRFLLEYFPRGTGFGDLAAPAATPDDLPRASVRAFSIDDSQTTEIDDALSVQPRDDGGVVVGIHIAAPALALARDSAWDQAARQRMSTVYMPGDKITMLPDELVQTYTLAEGSCPPAVSLYVDFDPELRVRGHETRVECVPIVANLRHDVLDAAVTEQSLQDDPDAQPYPCARDLAQLWRVAQQLKAGREQVRGRPERAGGVDYTFRVEGLEHGEESARVDIVPRRRGAPLDLIVAEMMILANATWGGWLAELGLPAIYRSQSGMGANLRTRMGTRAAPHQGLGVAQYAWCTSPLRRYADLVNQGQLIAAARHGRAAGLVAPYRPKDAQLFAVVGAFEEAYKAYADFQRGMERYWTLRYLRQQGISQADGAVLREGLVRIDDMPLVLAAAGAQELPRGTRVRVQFGEADLIPLEQPCRVAQVLHDTAPAEDAEAGDAGDTAESDDASLAGGLRLEVDAADADAQTEPAAPAPAEPAQHTGTLLHDGETRDASDAPAP
ncbi:MAG: RNB domain-containing ribonuclease, partial [Betaproteobacteria bacterium]|nr:RNB domain-containing ribonuclease [Betaproteobacteria bacterium]